MIFTDVPPHFAAMMMLTPASENSLFTRRWSRAKQLSLKQDLLGFIVSFSIQLVSWFLLFGFNPLWSTGLKAPTNFGFSNAVAAQKVGGGNDWLIFVQFSEFLTAALRKEKQQLRVMWRLIWRRKCSYLGQQGPAPRLWNWPHNVTKGTSQRSSKSVPPKTDSSDSCAAQLGTYKWWWWSLWYSAIILCSQAPPLRFRHRRF